MNEDILKQYLFTLQKDSMGDPFWFLELNMGANLWWIKEKMYIAGYDTPNEHHAILVRCKDELDLIDIIDILTRK